jgi:transcriptional regulator with XRE-family HTH domain
MTDLENNLREICKRKGLRLSDVADRVGTSQSNLVSSVKGNPTISRLQDIASSCPDNGIVYDPFMGSGTTAVATIQVGGAENT